MHLLLNSQRLTAILNTGKHGNKSKKWFSKDQPGAVLTIKYLINLSVQNIKTVNEEYTSMFNKYILLYNCPEK